MKVLVLSESIAGSGHTKAANNLAKGIQLTHPSAEVKVDTSLSRVSPFLEKWSSRLYMSTIKTVSPLWGWAYEREKEWSLIGKNLLRKFISGRLEPFLREEQPDIIISTHAFCLGGLAELKSRMEKAYLLGAAMTDYCTNRFWIHDEVDFYFVGTDQLKQTLVNQYMIPPGKIYVTGIPIDPQFASLANRSLYRRRYHISDQSTLILVSGGGLGLAPYHDILGALAKVQEPLHVAVLTGRNQRVREKLEQSRCHFPHPLLLLDYVENMSDWMGAADLMIGKPGGLTVSEAMACGLPLLIYKPIPGQEERNSRFLTESEVALRAENKKQLTYLVQQFCQHPSLGQRIRDKLALLGKPTAAFQVGKILFQAEGGSLGDQHNYH